MKNYLLGGVLAIWMSIPLVVSASPSGWVLGSPISQSDWISNAAGSNDNEKCTTVLNRTSCDYTGPSKALRVNYEYEFADEFWAGSQDRRLKNGCGRVQEAGNYNLGDNPNFGWTSAVTSDPWVYKNTSKVIIKANKYYQINAKPENRSSSNLLVKYVVEYANDAAATTRYQHTECYPYEISWCGDGVVDTDWFKKDPSDPAEECDPESPSWKNRSDGKTCNSECKIVEPADPECSSTYNGKTQYTTSSSQWLTSSTPGLCKEGTLTGFSYSGTPRSYTWNCVVGSKVTSPSCSAKQQWCGDGEKNGDEDCDDGSKNGTSASTCSSSCTTVGSASCGTANGGTTYFSTKQTTPWLTKTSSGLCPSGLTASTPTIEGTDSHLEWKCSNANGGEKTCKAYQEYCGDGVKNGGEECDGTAGCDSQCNKITPAEGCKYTFTNKLRYGDEIQFSDTFDAGWHDRYLYYGPDDVIFKENHGDYNNGSNPVFQWTSSLTNGGMKVPANTSMVVMESKLPKYHIVKYPSQRAWDNIYVEYTIWYENSNLTPKPSKSNLYSHKECAYYEITRCGDGVIDENYGEECDPGSAGTSTLPDGRICNSNCKIEDAPSKKGTLDVDKVLISETKYVTEVGQEMKWKVTVKAVGGDVKNVTIKDYLPDILTYVTYTPDLPSGVTMNSGQPTNGKDSKGDYIQWQTSGTLKEGKMIVLEITTKVNKMPKTTDNYENVACAKAENVDEDCKPVPIIKEGTLEVDKTLISETKYVTEVGQEMKWKVTVKAVGGDVKNVTIKDYLPDVLTYVTYTPDLPSGVTMNSGQPTNGKDSKGDYIQWQTTGTLKEGKTIVLEITTKVNKMPKTTDNYENVACAKAENVDEDCKPVPIGKGTLVPEKTLVGSKEVKKVGDLVLWKLKVTAVGGDVEDPIITDKLPPVLGYSGYMVSNYPSGVTIPDPTFGTEDSLETIEWKTTGTLKENDYIEIQLTTYAKVMPDKEYNNVLCVKTKDTPEDCVPVPIPAPKLRIKKTFSDGTKEKTVKVGDEIEYKVSFGNKGDASATITSIKDFLPKNVKYISSEIYINGESVHTNNPSGGEVINSSKKVDGVYIDIYGGITLEPGAEGYILIKGKILEDNQDNRTNFACVYLNDKKPDDSVIDGDRCDDAVHNFENGLLCKAPEFAKKSFTSAGGSTTVTCKTSKGTGDIELSCGDGATLSGSKASVLTGSNISSLTGTCVYPSNSSSSSKSYSVQCKVNGETGDSCKDTVTVSGTTPPGCFPAGTKVTMADGTKKNIEEVREGDIVLSYNTETNNNEGNVVKKLLVHEDNIHEMYELTINGKVLKVTDVHRFYVRESANSENYSWIEAKDLKVGNILLMEDGRLVEIEKINHYPNKETVYNLTVENNHDYFVAEGYLVHNSKGSPSCDKITTNPETLASGKDIEVTCKTSGGSAYVLIDCNYKSTNKYDGTNKDKTYFVSDGLVTTFTGTCKNYQLDTKIQCLVKESSSTSWENVTAKSDCGKIKNSSSPTCFPAGTKVTMADGTKKNIEDIEEGDMVLSYNTDTNTNESSTVAKTIIHENSEHEMYELTINGKVLKATAVHPFYVRKSGFTNMYNRTFGAKNLIVSIDYDWVEAQDLKVGDKLLMIDGSLVEIEKINHYPNKETVYNLEVEGNHDYFVDQGYLVHNKSCFLAGTKVIMADGTIKNIEDVKIGEKVLGSNGSINTVLSYDRHLLGERRVWSINGGEYFVSDEHPFMTTEGWKSFVPEKTKEELGWDIPELKVGDVLVTSNGLEKIERVDSKEMDRDTPIYNFVLDGDHTYHANGYLVHNKDNPTPTSCFVAGTQVTMADGTKKNIEDVELGEKVLGSNGSINTVLGFDRHILGERKIWSINGGEYFVSDEHPFKTTEGWKSFVPEKTKEEIGWTIPELKVGDILVTSNGLEKIERVDSKTADYNTPIYNFILDGDHTYHANGYLVHNKGTEILSYPLAECFDINANQLSYEQREILPFYWNLDNLSKEDIWYASGSKTFKAGDKCDEDAEGLIALNSMVCSYAIIDPDLNTKLTGNFPCLTEENFTVSPFYKSRLDIGKQAMCGTSNKMCYFSFSTKASDTQLWSKLNVIKNFGDGWTRFGEYRIDMTKIAYLQCQNGEWKSAEKSGILCNSTFMLTNPYTVQKTPSGNFKASTEALSNYRYCEKYEKVTSTNDIPKCLSWNNADKLLNAIAVSEYQPNDAVNKAMDKFINKYSKLAVSAGNGLKKVPGKNIYFAEGKLDIGTDFKVSSPTTIVQMEGNTEIRGNVDKNNLMLLTRGKIIFTDTNSCRNRQTVKGIFYAEKGIERTPVQKNKDDTASQRCTQGGLTVKGVLIGNGLKDVMQKSRSNLNGWHKSKTAQKVMDGASVLIEYSPSVFTKSTMPPGAEDFTTALSIYKD